MSSRITELELQNASLINKDRIAEDIGNTVVLAPHPDDESLGCGGLIALLTMASKEVTVLFITNGAASHLHSKEYPPQKLALLREEEAKKACETLGVHSENVFFLNAADGQLTALPNSERHQLIEKIKAITANKTIQSILIPWRRDPHPDHVATNQIGNTFINTQKKKFTLIEYPIWLWKNGKQEDWPYSQEVQPIRLAIDDVQEVKENAIRKHKSQLGQIIKDDPSGFVLSEELLEPFLGAYEYFFVGLERNMDSLSKSYFEQIYSESKDPWNFKNSSYEQKKYKHTIESLGQKHFKNGLEIGCSIGVQTNLLADSCDHLLAIDISELAIEEAKINCKSKKNVTFRVANAAKDFPEGKFDLITLCEVGYYFDKENLFNLFQHIDKALLKNGTLLVVHWIGFVPEYPLSGDDVHNKINDFLATKNEYSKTISERNEQYRLEVWEKTN